MHIFHALGLTSTLVLSAMVIKSFTSAFSVSLMGAISKSAVAGVSFVACDRFVEPSFAPRFLDRDLTAAGGEVSLTELFFTMDKGWTTLAGLLGVTKSPVALGVWSVELLRSSRGFLAERSSPSSDLRGVSGNGGMFSSSSCPSEMVRTGLRGGRGEGALGPIGLRSDA